MGPHDDCVPKFVLRVPGICVLFKPATWETDACELSGVHSLGCFLQSVLVCPVSAIASDTCCDFGLLHRLDAPSSGLLLMGCSYEAYRYLQHAACSYSLFREYVVDLMGYCAPALHAVCAPMFHIAATEQALACMHGKVALTWVMVLAFSAIQAGVKGLASGSGELIKSGASTEARLESDHMGKAQKE